MRMENEEMAARFVAMWLRQANQILPTIGGSGAFAMQTDALSPTSNPQTMPDLQADLRRARWLANWLDARFSILGIRFGLEGIVGLLPVVGDTLGMLAGMYPIYLAHKHRLGRGVQLLMALNLLIEWLLGITPLVGDLADIWYKANLRNLRLLEVAADHRTL